MKFTEHEGLIYKGGHTNFELLGFMDSDYGGNRDNRKSMSYYAFHFVW